MADGAFLLSRILVLGGVFWGGIWYNNMLEIQLV